MTRSRTRSAGLGRLAPSGLAIRLRQVLPGPRSFDDSPERRLLLVVAALKIAGLIVVLSATGLSGFDLPKTAWSRAAAWLMAGLIVIAMLRYGPGILPRGPVALAALALLAANLLATTTAAHPYTALFGERGRYLGLFAMLDLFILFVGLAMACRRSRDWGWPLGAAALAGAIAFGYAVLQYAGLDPVGWSSAGGRPFGTFGNANMFGHFLGTLAAAATAFGLFAGDPRLRRTAGALAAMAALLILFVATRGALLGLLAGAVVLTALAVRRRGPAGSRGLALGAAGLALAFGVALALTPIGSRLGTLAGGPELADRLVIWEGSARAFTARPVLGWGPDSLGVAFPHVRAPGTEHVHAGAVLVDQAHNWLLHALATTGLVGAVTLLLLLITTIRSLWRALPREPALAGALLAGSAAYWTHGLVAVESVTVSWIPWVAAAGAVALDRPRAATAGAGSSLAASRRVPALAAAGVALLAIIAATTAGGAARANEAIGQAAILYRAGQAGPVTEAANRALAHDAGRGEYWNYRGLARQLRQLWSLAAQDYEQASQRAPHQVNFIGNLARARAHQAAAGDQSGGGAAAAFAAAREAVALEPNLSASHRALAEVALILRDPETALVSAVRAITLAPRDASADATAVAAAARHPDRARARTLLEQAVALRPSAALAAALAGLR